MGSRVTSPMKVTMTLGHKVNEKKKGYRSTVSYKVNEIQEGRIPGSVERQVTLNIRLWRIGIVLGYTY